MRNVVGVPLLVVSQHDDHLAIINAALREAGHAVHCQRVGDAQALDEALGTQTPELVLICADEPDIDVNGLLHEMSRRAPAMPVLLVHREVTETQLGAALEAGARDVVSLTHRSRLQAIVARELHIRRLQNALDNVHSSASQYRQELRNLMKGATEAIADVQEGIVVSANPAWLGMFQLATEQDLAGQPFMDLFSHQDQPSLKGALQACLKDRWQDDLLPVTATRRDGSTIRLELRLERVSIDGESAIRVIVPADTPAETAPESVVDAALNHDPATGLLLRQQFLDHCGERLARPLSGGVRAIAYLRPDRFSRTHLDVGLLGTEALITRFGELLRELLQPNDICSRFGGTIFTVLLERGTLQDVEAWTEQLRKAVAGRVFEVDSQSTTLTCTIGVSLVDPAAVSLQEPLVAAEKACRSGRGAGGNKVEFCDSTSATQKLRVDDAVWVPRIRAALIHNRFRLIHQPIASLTEDTAGMFDTLLRMVGEDDTVILPGEFVPPAERANLIKNIDRWVIGASLSFCAAQQPTRLFVRLSRDSVLDETLPEWLVSRLRSLAVQPEKLCFQVSEEIAARHTRQTREMAERLIAAGFLFAIDHAGTGRDSAQLLQHVPMQFMKIDGSLMQGLHRDPDQQRKVSQLVQVARKLGIRSIAERVEDAKTMAVLWQLGIAYFQGNFVQTRGVVLESEPAIENRAAG